MRCDLSSAIASWTRPLIVASVVAIAALPAVAQRNDDGTPAALEESPNATDARASLRRPGVPPTREELAALATKIERIRRRAGGGAITVSVFANGQTWERAFGLADVNTRRKATPNTSFRMASVTKSFTAVAILQLWERGQIDLDAPIQRYLPNFPKKRKGTVTVRALLGHLSGIPHYRGLPGERSITEHKSTEQSIAIFKDWPLVVPPGSKYVYTSYGYNLLGAVIENVSGLSYGQYLKRHVFGQTKMKRSIMDNPSVPVTDKAKGYRLSKGGRLTPSRFVNISSRFAGGGTRSTVIDMRKFGRALLAGKLIRPSTVRLMLTSMATNDGRLTDYGMGFATYPQSGRAVASHAGAQPETSTLLTLFPGENAGFALASNVEDRSRVLGDIAAELTATFLDGGAHRRTVAALDPIEAVMIGGLYKAFGHGLAHETRLHTDAAQGVGDLIRAFEVFNDTLAPERIASDRDAVVAVVEDGHNPIGGRTFTKVGAHMAGVIANHRGRAHLLRYHTEGPLQFGLDYIEACRAFDCPTSFRLSSALQTLLRERAPEYARANAPGIRALQISKATPFEDVAPILRAAFVGTMVRPDFSKELGAAAVHHAVKRRKEKARAFQWLVLELFPSSTKALIAAGESEVLLAPDADTAYAVALPLYQKAFAQVGGTNLLSPVRFRIRAAQFSRLGHPHAALALARIAAQVHTDDVRTLDSAAKREARAKNHDRARMYYERAEALSPSRKRQRKLAQLKKRLAAGMKKADFDGGTE